jgi:hypothetical protein
MTLKPQMNHGFAMSQMNYGFAISSNELWFCYVPNQKTTTAYVPSSMIIPTVGNQDHTHQNHLYLDHQ